jgi:predicted CoA-binding protein
MTKLERIQDFLGQKRFAIVGVSQNSKDFSRILFREFCGRGYDPVPVNPAATEIEGRRCFARLQDVQPPVDGVLLMTSPPITETVVHDCGEAGVRRVWMYRARGAGAVSADAVRFCESSGMSVIPGECPYMFLPGAGLIHRVHGLIRKISHSYPH